MEYNLKVNMNEYLPLRDVVFNTLRDAILKGELEPGEHTTYRIGSTKPLCLVRFLYIMKTFHQIRGK